ncbi:uncharacterized protein Z519_10145 [Cladophialophora bantiana CBS 173.52]|uniref:Uncharacterized protein n=1 Tax=Cladophialophora bantiana (strain ATCC 10958 / CBS 173.52 / CDC B-1940 / NIH 8579) TaxID=1442370 RepID=A0A0D2FRS7_CLAB1|nr:uncharacterized protein Z519_10145 [Cladophialophora bantiana CBS 173.52]KIW89292.1 hypothetical protein Z519_10145 [Cladophialophora bantiana CBS 173.52]
MWQPVNFKSSFNAHLNLLSSGVASDGRENFTEYEALIRVALLLWVRAKVTSPSPPHFKPQQNLMTVSERPLTYAVVAFEAERLIAHSEEFDISQIPDDRDETSGPKSDAEPDHHPVPAPDESADMPPRSGRKYARQPMVVKQKTNAPRRESNKRNRRRRRSSNNTSNGAASEVSKRKSPPFSQYTNTSPNYRPLKDTEPETYHIYATSDTSDAQSAEGSVRYGGITPFPAGDGASGKNTAPVPNVTPPDDNLVLEQAEASHEDPAPEMPVATGTKSTNGGTCGPVAAQPRQPENNDESWFLCPLADAHNCKLTFATRKSAMRHSNVHTTSFVCVVCKKQMSRKDTLAKHMKLHNALQIALAEASSNPVEDAQPEEPEQRQPPQPNVGAHAEVKAGEPPGEPPEESSIKLTTPVEELELQEHGHHTEVETRPEGQEGPKVEMSEATPNVDLAEEVSDQQSISPSSLFDEAAGIIVKETPMPNGSLKRKGSSEDGAGPQRPSLERARKRRKESPSSPPTSDPPNEMTMLDSTDMSIPTDVLQSRQLTDKIVPRLQKRQANMDGWAQNYIPGSGLRHPILNPEPPPPPSRPAMQQMEVVISRTSQAGPSSIKPKKKIVLADREMGTDHEGAEVNAFEGLGRKKRRKATYATPKGKKRAEADVDYSTPTKDPTNGEVGLFDTVGDIEPMDIATSVAKRTFPARRGQKRGDSQEDDDSDFVADQNTESEDEMARAEPANKATKVTKAPKMKGSRNGDLFECGSCHRRFANQDSLNNHLRQPSAHVGLLRCQRCSEEFWASTALAEHEKDTGHGKGNGLQGRIGPFSQIEVEKLNRWRDQFCEKHNISRVQFNDMMTDTMVREKGSSWIWPFIGRTAFLKEYVDVLPNRNKRSLLRYRERNFQNVEGSKNWTAEDDKELIRLHKELGPKWAEIAKRLTRTVDAVSQRWGHKLRYGEVDTGEWSRAEDDRFRKILEELRHDSDENKLRNHRIPWNKVSEKMGTRSAQQCSNHYRAQHAKKARGTWIKMDDLEPTSASSKGLPPSKMELRLRGQKLRARYSKKSLSEEYILDEDESSDADRDKGQRDCNAPENDKSAKDDPNEDTSINHESDSEADVEIEGQSRSSAQGAHEADSVPHTRIPVIAKTPGKTLRSSQLFEQTQANTSALKPSQTSSRKARLQASQKRPSPDIPIQQRRLESKSPLQGIPVLENGELNLEEVEEEDEENESKSEVSDAEESEDSDAAQQTDEEQRTPLEDSADESEDGPAGHLVDDKATETEYNDDDDHGTLDTGGDLDEDDGDTDDNVDEGALGGDGEDEDEDEDDEDEVASGGNTSSFMDSINESAKRSRIRSSQSLLVTDPRRRDPKQRKLDDFDQDGSDEE